MKLIEKTGLEMKKSGERGRNRTFNLLIKSQLLCQLSYAPGLGGSGAHVNDPQRLA
jgi:hypothetical protein